MLAFINGLPALPHRKGARASFHEIRGQIQSCSRLVAAQTPWEKCRPPGPGSHLGASPGSQWRGPAIGLLTAVYRVRLADSVPRRRICGFRLRQRSVVKRMGDSGLVCVDQCPLLLEGTRILSKPKLHAKSYPTVCVFFFCHMVFMWASDWLTSSSEEPPVILMFLRTY